MKVQQIGLVLGMNVVAACLMMQGCKATKPGAGGAGYKPVEPVVVEEQTPPPEPPAAQRPVVQVTDVPELPPPPAPKTPVVKPVAPIAPVADKPAAAPAPKRPAPAAGEVYVVQKGDSLSKISKRFNVKLGAIVAANPGIKPDRIRIGQKVKIPGAAPASVAAAAPSAPAAKKAPAAMPASASAANLTPPPVKTSSSKSYTGATKKYVVKAGDTLGGIAHDSGISVRALKELNGLERNTVRIGQELKVPAEKQVAATKKAAGAKAEAKDAKKAAAEKPAAAKADGKKDAGKSADAAKDGDKKDAAAVKPDEAKDDAAPVAAADAEAPAPAADAAPKADEPKADGEDAVAPVSGRTHVVKEGEDLVSIAIEHTVSPTSLIEVNNLKVTDGVKPGQVLKLPANAK